MKIQTVGIDIGKTVFHLGAMDERGKVVVRKRFSRTQLLAYTVNLPPCSQTCNSTNAFQIACRGVGNVARRQRNCTEPYP